MTGGLVLTSHDDLYWWDESHLTDCGPLVLGGAGVSPAVFVICTHHKAAGETPAPQLGG